MRKRNAPRRPANGLEKARARGAEAAHYGRDANPYNPGSAKAAAWQAAYADAKEIL